MPNAHTPLTIIAPKTPVKGGKQNWNTRVFPTWCPGCVTPDTQIITNPGVREINTLKVGEKVFGSDGDFHQITRVYNHVHSGKMYRVTTKCFGESVLTHEHPVLMVRRQQKKRHNTTFNPEWIEAQHLKIGDYALYPIPRKIKDQEWLEMPYERKLMDRKSKPLPFRVRVDADLLKLAGYYIAEGHCHDRELNFTFSTDEHGFVDGVSRLLRRIFKVQTRFDTHKPTSITVVVSSSTLARAFTNLFGNGAFEKHLPHFMLQLPLLKQRSIIQAAWEGDGWVEGTGRRANYRTISPVLAQQMKLLLLRQGIVPTIVIDKARGIHKQSYSLQIVSRNDMQILGTILGRKGKLPNSKRSLNTVRDRKYVYLPIRKIESFDHQGMVWNLAVDKVESYVTNNATLHNCGDFGIWAALKQALTNLGKKPEEVVIVYGVGCSGNMTSFVNTYAFHGLHGRALPVAEGIKLANDKLTVIVVAGDGDGYGIGVGHFIHALRRNFDLTYIVHNNAVYGLTTGQTSPTALKGFKSKSTPEGVIEEPVNPLALAITTGATFVSRSQAADIPHLAQTIEAGIKHNGFSLVDVFQHCATFNKVNTVQWYREHVYKVEKPFGPQEKAKAIEKTLESGRYPVGVLYHEEHPAYDDEVTELKKGPLVERDISNVDITPLFDEFR